MRAFTSPMLATSSPDGVAAWRAVVGEFRRTLDDPMNGWPILAAIVGMLLFVWINLRVARLLLASLNNHHEGPDPVDHTH